MKKFALISVAALLLAGCEKATVQAGANPIAVGPDQMVHLIWKQATQEWMVRLNGGPEVKPGDARTELKLNTGPTKFVIDVPGNQNPPFKPGTPLTVWTGDKMQPKPGIEGSQILGPIVTNDGKLVFYNLNQGAPVTLNYAIHFTGLPSVDPIIDNGGTNR